MHYWITLVVVIVSDLITKKVAEIFLSERAYDPLPFLKLFLIHNRGAAFGILSEAPDILRLPLLLLTPLVALVITFLYASKTEDKTTKVIMGMIGGGALGNLYDRIFLGEVRDFIHLHLGDLYWPAFNLADASITLSIAALLLMHLKKS